MLDDDWKDIWFAAYITALSTSASLFLWAIYEAWR